MSDIAVRIARRMKVASEPDEWYPSPGQATQEELKYQIEVEDERELLKQQISALEDYVDWESLEQYPELYNRLDVLLQELYSKAYP